MIFISEDACEPLVTDLKKAGHDIFTVKSADLVYDAVSAHPDIYMCRIKRTLVIDDMIETEPDIRAMYDREMEQKLGDASEKPMIPAMQADSGGYIVFQTGGIGHDYPYDVAYDAVSTEKYFIHNFEYTSPLLLDRARDAGLEFVNVKQGYTKCACCVAGDQAIITADEGICRTIAGYNEMLDSEGLPEEKIDVLKIEPGHVALPGLNYGFLGGASGLVDGRLYFNGDLSAHPDCDAIAAFTRAHGAEPVWYENEPLTDIGSIVYFE